MTRIEWTDKTWCPTVGCSRVSAGCENCYAERFAHRGLRPEHKGLTANGSKGPRWTGEVRCLPERLEQPLHWRKPRRVFVDSMSDLFHEAVPDKFIADVFAVMAVTPEHTYQILTKRPERMREWCRHGWASTVRCLLVAREGDWVRVDPSHLVRWPLPNVWLGVSCENQETADERIPELLKTPAAVRFVSLEPLLGRVSLRGLSFDEGVQRWDGPWTLNHDALTGRRATSPYSDMPGPHLDWVIVGGESGPGARPCHVNWIRSIRDQCQTAGVACFIKQLGSAPLGPLSENFPHYVQSDWSDVKRKGGNPEEWPAPLRVREFPE